MSVQPRIPLNPVAGAARRGLVGRIRLPARRIVFRRAAGVGLIVAITWWWSRVMQRSGFDAGLSDAAMAVLALDMLVSWVFIVRAPRRSIRRRSRGR